MRYSLEKQEKKDYCFVACLQAVLKNYGINLSQEHIATQTDCGEKGILDLSKIDKFIEPYNLLFEYYWYDEVLFGEYDILLNNLNRDYLIARPNNSNGYHVFLLEEFKDPELTLINPEDCSIEIINLENLLKEMKPKSGGFGFIERL